MIYVITDDLNVELNHDNKRGVSEIGTPLYIR